MEQYNDFIDKLKEKYEVTELWKNLVGSCYKIEIRPEINVELSISINFNKRHIIPKEYKDIWLSALRSGKFSQTTARLQSKQGYCCLGVWAYCQENPNYEEVKHIGLKNYDSDAKVLNGDDKLASIIGQLGYFVGFSVDGFVTLVGLNDVNFDFIKTSWVIENLF